MQYERRKSASRHLWNPLKKRKLPAPKCIGTPLSKKQNFQHLNALEVRLRNTRTAAGFVSRPCKTSAEKVLPVTLRNTRTAAGLMSRPCKTSAEKMLHVTFGIHYKKTKLPAPKCIGTPPSKKTQFPAPKCLGTAPSKHSNSSRIRVQAMQNERRKSASRHLWNP